MPPSANGFDVSQRTSTGMPSKPRDQYWDYEVPVAELLTASFLTRCSRLGSVVEFFDALGCRADSAEGFAATSIEQRDRVVRGMTSYGSWNEMIRAAVKEWVKTRLPSAAR
jgi:hypothetical protein